MVKSGQALELQPGANRGVGRVWFLAKISRDYRVERRRKSYLLDSEDVVGNSLVDGDIGALMISIVAYWIISLT